VAKELSHLASDVSAAVDVIRSSRDAGGQLLIASNGGSAADAQHIAAELTGRSSASGVRCQLWHCAVTHQLSRRLETTTGMKRCLPAGFRLMRDRAMCSWQSRRVGPAGTCYAPSRLRGGAVEPAVRRVSGAQNNSICFYPDSFEDRSIPLKRIARIRARCASTAPIPVPNALVMTSVNPEPRCGM